MTLGSLPACCSFRPVVRYLALSIGRVPKEQTAFVQLEGYPLWCEEAAAECHEAILAGAVKPDSVVLPVTILQDLSFSQSHTGPPRTTYICNDDGVRKHH